MSKHTPRPWVLVSRTSVKGPDDKYIASTPANRPYEEAEANARLIAAAPDLKEELLNVRDSLAGALAGTMPLREIASDLLESVQDAIAKAEGRQ